MAASRRSPPPAGMRPGTSARPTRSQRRDDTPRRCSAPSSLSRSAWMPGGWCSTSRAGRQRRWRGRPGSRTRTASACAASCGRSTRARSAARPAGRTSTGPGARRPWETGVRPGAELAVALGIVTVLGVVVAAAGSRNQRPQDEDVRRSTYLTGPYGARGYAEALELVGVRVARLRERTPALARHGESSGELVYAALDPSIPLSPLDALHVRRFALSGGSLLLAGPGAVAAMQCYGYAVMPLPGGRAIVDKDTLRVGAVLRAAPAAAPRRGLLLDDGSAVACPPVPIAGVDTLLSASGQPVVLRLEPDSGGPVILAADGTLFTNRLLRETAGGELALGLLAGGSRGVLFDEYHHGFGASGGMVSAVRRWSARSPWGWALWQLGIVGVLALLAGAVRFGPARQLLQRRRRSALEHVRARAPALAAARGRTVAIGLLVRGLRRRLARPGEAVRGDPGEWLATLAARVRTPVSEGAVATLQALTSGPADAEGVRRAALAVEDVWVDRAAERRVG